MAKDYGTRRPAKRRNSSSPKQLFWLLATFLCGYLAATVFDFTSLSSWVNTNILTKKKLGKPQAQVVAKEPDLPKPKFEFYTLLAKDRRNATQTQLAKIQPDLLPIKPQSPQSPTVAAKPVTTASMAPKSPVVADGKPVAQNSATKDSYLIQLAAFKNRQDAEHMKAALTLKGFDVQVVTSSPQHGNWFRVIAGPFSSRAVAEKAQISLAQNERIKGMIRRMEG